MATLTCGTKNFMPAIRFVDKNFMPAIRFVNKNLYSKNVYLYGNQINLIVEIR